MYDWDTHIQSLFLWDLSENDEDDHGYWLLVVDDQSCISKKKKKFWTKLAFKDYLSDQWS